MSKEENADQETPLELPKMKIKAQLMSPKNLIIFSKPKVGKTTLLAELDDCLLLDFEGGSDYVDAMKIKVDSIDHLKKIGNSIKSQEHPYKYIGIDTTTALEDMCIPYAEMLYSRTSMGTNWYSKHKSEYGNILNLPNGAGYKYLRDAFVKVIEYIKTLAPRVILLGHIKDIKLDKNDSGGVFSSMDLDLTGKLKRITTSQSDAIGYLYRKDNQNILSFKTTEEVVCGARPNHLKNKEIVISEVKEDGKIETHWDRIYID